MDLVRKNRHENTAHTECGPRTVCGELDRAASGTWADALLGTSNEIQAIADRGGSYTLSAFSMPPSDDCTHPNRDRFYALSMRCSRARAAAALVVAARSATRFRSWACRWSRLCTRLSRSIQTARIA
jgi:hypothetical protein